MLRSVLKDLELSPYGAAALGNEKHWCVEDLIQTDRRSVSPVLGMLSGGHPAAKKQTHNPTMSNMMPNNNEAKRRASASKNALPKYSSSLEVPCS